MSADERPRRREDDLLIEPMDAELLVCDVRTDSAHVLNEPAARVWRACDGRRDLAGLQAECGLEAEVVELALESLAECDLLDSGGEVGGGVSRRTMLRRAAAAGAVLPVISSITLPTPAMAQSVPPPKTTGPPAKRAP